MRSSFSFYAPSSQGGGSLTDRYLSRRRPRAAFLTSLRATHTTRRLAGGSPATVTRDTAMRNFAGGGSLPRPLRSLVKITDSFFATSSLGAMGFTGSKLYWVGGYDPATASGTATFHEARER